MERLAIKKMSEANDFFDSFCSWLPITQGSNVHDVLVSAYVELTGPRQKYQLLEEQKRLVIQLIELAEQERNASQKLLKTLVDLHEFEKKLFDEQILRIQVFFLGKDEAIDFFYDFYDRYLSSPDLPQHSVIEPVKAKRF
ncbi:MAG: hypothetical protein R2865_08890 [Deinococcales bacterium]